MKAGLSRIFAVVMLAMFGLTGIARADTSTIPASDFNSLAFQQKPGAKLPPDVSLHDESGETVPLSRFFDGKPVILVFEYLRCPNLCGLVLSGLFRGLAGTQLRSEQDYRVLAISIDPREGPAEAIAARQDYAAGFGADNVAGWHFLTGTEADVRRVAGAVGFPYRWDAAISQFAHPAGIIVMTPTGTVSRYLFGTDYEPLDLRLALADSSRGKVAAAATRLLLLCYAYDPKNGRYGLAVTRVLQAAGLLTVAAAGVFIVGQLRREART